MIFNSLFGKRLYYTDPELGKFHSEKKVKHSEPILWSHSSKILNQKLPTMQQFQGNTKGIYPKIRTEYLQFLNHYQDKYKPFLDEKTKEYKDLLSFENLQYDWAEIYGVEEKNKAIIQFLGRETSQNFLIRFSMIDNEIKNIFIA